MSEKTQSETNKTVNSDDELKQEAVKFNVNYIEKTLKIIEKKYDLDKLFIENEFFLKE